jgi:tetratricopeptide (TPR) repeat protein
MNIRKYIIPVILTLMGLTFYSCNDMLEVNPTSEVASNYFTTENRIQRGVGGAYANFASIYGTQYQIGSPGPMHPFWLLPGDDLIQDGSGSTYDVFAGLTGADVRVDGMWKRMYQIVSRCNFMLEKIEEPEVIAVYKDAALKNYNRGELLFLRSYVEMKLWDWFRKAPIQHKFISSIEEAILPPSKDFEMLDAAIASLEEAATLLPVSWDQKNLGRITKDGAYGLLTKCYTLRACYNNKNTGDYSKAITAFEKISNSRRLVNFGDNFDYRTENNDESLFEYQASFNLKEDNSWLDNGFEGEGGSSGQMGSFYSYSSDHWGSYGCGKIGPSAKLISSFSPKDPRMAETFSQNPDNLGGKLWWVYHWDKFGGNQLVKYVNGARGDCYDNKWSITSANNPRILRLADVKLIAAEAYLSVGKSGDALKQVNDVRERARKSTSNGVESSVPAALTSVTIQDIMNERFLELAGEEGHRWTDLRRWHAAGYINLSTWTATDFGYNYDASGFEFKAPRNLLYPIPVSELNRNPLMSASGQNPGY